VLLARCPQPYFDWIKWLSPIKYGFAALMKNEFTGLTMTFRQLPPLSGDKVLKQFGLDGQGSIAENLLAVMGIYLLLLVLAYVSLWKLVKGRQAVDVLASSTSKTGSSPALTKDVKPSDTVV